MRLTLLALPLFLTACGAIYTSPSLKNKNSEQVTVHEVTLSILPSINSTPYVPKSIPAALGNIEAYSKTPTAQALVPKPAEIQTKRPKPQRLVVPPKVAFKPYQIGISDVILLATPTPTLDAGVDTVTNKRQGYTVQDDGSISVPDVGRIKVAGMSLKDAENAVFNALVDRQIDPKFSLEIAEFNSQRVSVGGAVNEPALAPISIKPLKLQDAIQLAGGLTADGHNDTVIRITRDDQEYQIPLEAMRSRPNLQRILLKDGDNVFVDQDYKLEQARAYNEEKLAFATLKLSAAAQERQNFLTKVQLGAIKQDHVFLAGEVISQGRFPLPFNNRASLADALYSARGINNDVGDPGQIYLLRLNKDETHIDAYHVNGSDAINLLLTTRIELRPNDMIFVSEQRITAWNRVITKIVPTFGIGRQLDN
jgi:polysaccharide export outer membrane protein